MTMLAANLRRLAWMARVLVAHLLAYRLRGLLRLLPRLARRLPDGDLSGPQRLRHLLEDLGGTFLKLGQMLALQPDVLSFAYCNALFDLLDRVAPLPYGEVEAVFRGELGRSPEEVFDAFDRRPIATASIGQVHAAFLGGQKLAVKIRRPSVEVDFAGDIRLVAAAITLIRRLRVERLDWLVEPLGELVAWTREELDYRHEARYAERLRANAAGNPAERVPAVVEALSTRRVLTVEYLEGVTVLAYLRALEAGDELTLGRVRAGGFDPEAYARNVIDNFLGDAFRHGVFHADLHPANLMILPGNAVGYVDFGITGVLSRYSRRHLIALTLAYTQGDVEAMGDHFFKVSTLDADADPEAFVTALRRLAEGWYAPGVGGRPRLRKNFTLVMFDMLSLSRATGVLPERDVVKYIRSAIAIDGLITRFAPAFDLGRHLEAVCDRHLQRELWRDLTSTARLTGWAATGTRLAADGPLKAAAFLRRLAAGDLAVAAVPLGGRSLRRGALRRQALALAALLFCLSALAAAGDLRLGANLASAHLLLAAAALGLLLRAVHRLTGEAR